MISPAFLISELLIPARTLDCKVFKIILAITLTPCPTKPPDKIQLELSTLEYASRFILFEVSIIELVIELLIVSS